MKSDYKFSSENAMQFISLHDCQCSHLYYSDNCLAFEMEWLEIMSEHPFNQYDKAHQSGKGKIEFKEPRLKKCTLNNVDGSVQEVTSLESLDFYDVLFLQFDEEKYESGFVAKMYLLFNNSTEFDTILLVFEYEKTISMWDDLKDVSWFEDKNRNN